MKILIDFAYLLTAVAISPVVLYRMARHKRYRVGWQNRFGKIARKHPDKKCIWIHAVSVGEVNATKTIITELENKFGDFEIVISTTTDTGFARASKLYSDQFAVFFFPLDFSPVMRRAFESIRPTMCLLMELEVWPNFAQIAHDSNIPVVVVNGRISDKSFPKYRLAKPLMKKIFQNVTLILAQTDEYADRFKAIGAPAEKVIVTGSLKYDTAQIADKVAGADELATQLNLGKEPFWIAGATGNDEEKIILDIYKELIAQFPLLRLAIVPRKPERFNEVAQLIQQADFDLIQYSRIKEGYSPPHESKQAVILGDTMGDLRKFYSLATIIFVGRSLVPMGGSDMIEAAALGKTTIFGPHTFNFNHTVNVLLKDNGAILVKDGDALLESIQKCLSDPNYAAQIARTGQNVIRNNQGATKKTVEQITKLLAHS